MPAQVNCSRISMSTVAQSTTRVSGGWLVYVLITFNVNNVDSSVNSHCYVLGTGFLDFLESMAERGI